LTGEETSDPPEEVVAGGVRGTGLGAAAVPLLVSLADDVELAAIELAARSKCAALSWLTIVAMCSWLPRTAAWPSVPMVTWLAGSAVAAIATEPSSFIFVVRSTVTFPVPSYPRTTLSPISCSPANVQRAAPSVAVAFHPSEVTIGADSASSSCCHCAGDAPLHPAADARRASVVAVICRGQRPIPERIVPSYRATACACRPLLPGGAVIPIRLRELQARRDRGGDERRASDGRGRAKQRA
jgi:hypothetical protein